MRAARNITLHVGDRFVMKSGGGGGVGDPLERDVEKVLEDVEEGVISVQKAHDVYGVVLDPATHNIDHASTDVLRAKLIATAD